MRTFTQFLTRYSYAPKRLPFILAFLLVLSSSLFKPIEAGAQACVSNSFQISGTESGFFDRNNERWTYLIFFVKNTNQNAISHMSFTLPTTGGCAPTSTYLGSSVTSWARGQYSSTKPISPIVNSLTMVYGKDNSCSVTKQQDVLKISEGEINKDAGMWVRLELKGTWTFDNTATINFKYGNACCTQALGTSGGGTGFFGCFWDCALAVNANYDNILCFGGTTTVTTVVTGAEDNPPVQYRIDNGQWQTEPSFNGVLAGQHKIDVKQGPCEGSYTFTVTQPASAVDLDLTHTDALCNGASSGSITATGKGGTPPYLYRLGDVGEFGEDNIFSNLVAGTYTVYVKDNNGCIKFDYETIEQPRPLDLTLTPTPVLCFGAQTGAISASASGGTPDYMYKLATGDYQSSGEFTGLAAGTYTVYVKDNNNCLYEESVTITQPASAVDLDLTHTDALCNGDASGSITATGKNGTPPYLYRLGDAGEFGEDNIFGNLAAGTYTVYVKDNNGCIKFDYETIEQPRPLDLTLTPTPVLCFGAQTGAISASASGGTPDYMYKLATGDYQSSGEFTGLAAGTYTVYVKDNNNCLYEESVTITQPASAVDLDLTHTDALCNGDASGSITATGKNGTPPYLYRLGDAGEFGEDNIFGNLAAGTYTVYVKDNNGCIKFDYETIEQPRPLDLTLTPTPVLCFGAQTGAISASASGGTPDYMYKLATGDYQSSGEFTGLAAGTYTVYVKDNNNCLYEESVTITQPASAVDLDLTHTDALCNGDASGSITATGKNGTPPYLYRLGDAGEFGEDNIFGNLAAGTYTVYVKDNNGCIKFDYETIEQPRPLDLTLTPTPVLCFGAQTGAISASASGGTPDYMYKLATGDYQSSGEFTGLAAGTYTVYVKDNNNCLYEESVTITQPASAVDLDLTHTDALCNGDASGSITATGKNGTPPYLYRLGDAGEFGEDNIFGNLAAGTYTVYVKDNNGCIKFDYETIEQPRPLDLTLTPTPVLCFGAQTGAISASASGGTPDYMYKLATGDYQSSGEFTGLAAGTYTVYVKDNNNCLYEESVTITQPASAVDLDLTHTDALCNSDASGSITATGKNGTPPYLYRLGDAGEFGEDNIFGNLAAGTYTVYVKDNNGCIKFDYETIEQPRPLDLTLTPTPVLCFGAQTGAISASASGGTPDYMYKLATGDYQSSGEFTGLAAGTYTVYVKDNNNCLYEESVTITQPASAVDLDLSSTNALCNGDASGSITATGKNGTPPYLYRLGDAGEFGEDNIFGNLAAGTYTVYVKDNHGCIKFDYETIEQPRPLDLTLTPTPVLCFGAQTGAISASASGGTPDYMYKLATGDYQSSGEFTGLAAGTYTVYVKDNNNCLYEESVTITQPASAVDLDLLSTNALCNGDASGSITATGKDGTPPYQYRLGDVGDFANNNIFNNLAAGTYTVYVKDGNGCITSKQIAILQPQFPLDLSLSQKDVGCYGDNSGSITASGSGGTEAYEYKLEGFDYQSSGEFKNLIAGTYTVYIRDANGCVTSKSTTIVQPDAELSLQLTPTSPLCNGGSTGSLKAVASGGTAPYKYQLEDGEPIEEDEFKDLPANTYTVHVIDANGCEAKATVTITDPPALDLTLTATDILCKGDESGSITAVASGGTEPYQYKLLGSYGPSGVFGGISAGTYTVYVKDANGCEYGEQIEVKEPLEFLTAESKADKDKVCSDEKTNVTITAKGGTPPYKYQYDAGTPGDNNVFSLGAGTHNFTVIDKNDCKATTSVTILSEVCGNFCTYTQGYFGNDEGLTTDGGGNASYKDGENCVSSRVANTINFALASASLPEKVGNIELSGLTATQIINFLPGGGPSVLFDGITLPTTTSKNALLAQLLTLALNMGLNADLADFKMPESGELWTQKAADCGSGTTTSSCTKYSFSAGKGLTVQAIFDAASYALITASVTNGERSSWTNTLDAINRGFDECARTCVPTVDPTLLLTGLIESERPTVTETSRTLKVKAYPNPFTDRIFINFTSPVAGKAVVEIFDMSGRRLAEINKGHVNAFAENKVEYMVPTSARSAIIYKVTVGSYSITGRMIAPTR